MRGLLQSLSLALLLTVGVGQAASADPILVADGRVLGAVTTVNNLDSISDDATPSAPFASFDGVATVTAADGSTIGNVTATQRSSVSPTRFHATATAESFANAPTVGDSVFTGGFSYFSVDFYLPTPYRFRLTDFMVKDDFQSTGTGDNLVLVSIENAESLVLQEGLAGTGTRQLTRTGILLAGIHGLLAQASTQSLGNPISEDDIRSSHQRASFDLDFQLTPVPEPGSMLLLGSGLVAFAARRVWRAA